LSLISFSKINKKKLKENFYEILPNLYKYQSELAHKRQQIKHNIPENEKGTTFEKIAEMTGVSDETVRKAVFVWKKSPVFYEKVKKNEISLEKAYRLLNHNSNKNNQSPPKENKVLNYCSNEENQSAQIKDNEKIVKILDNIKLLIEEITGKNNDKEIEEKLKQISYVIDDYFENKMKKMIQEYEYIKKLKRQNWQFF